MCRLLCCCYRPLALALLCLSSVAWSGVASHAPIGVMGDHLHKQGEWMLSYRYMDMRMDGMLNGSYPLSIQQVKDQDFSMVPTQMDMSMDMLGLMYAPTDNWTLMAMVTYLSKDMDMVMGMMNMPMDMESSGLGDVKLGGLYRLSDVADHHRQWMLNIALSLPTGDIDEVSGTNVQPFAMQLGSGTYDATLGTTYTLSTARWLWGAQAIATIRTGKNGQGYRLGNRLMATGWLMRPINENLSFSGRALAQGWGNVSGSYAGMDTSTPAADPSLQGGQQLSLLLGVNLMANTGALMGNRLAIELGKPVYQHLDGPQMAQEWTATAGWQLAFK